MFWITNKVCISGGWWNFFWGGRKQPSPSSPGWSVALTPSLATSSSPSPVASPCLVAGPPILHYRQLPFLCSPGRQLPFHPSSSVANQESFLFGQSENGSHTRFCLAGLRIRQIHTVTHLGGLRSHALWPEPTQFSLIRCFKEIPYCCNLCARCPERGRMHEWGAVAAMDRFMLFMNLSITI